MSEENVQPAKKNDRPAAPPSLPAVALASGRRVGPSPDRVGALKGNTEEEKVMVVVEIIHGQYFTDRCGFSRQLPAVVGELVEVTLAEARKLVLAKIAKPSEPAKLPPPPPKPAPPAPSKPVDDA